MAHRQTSYDSVILTEDIRGLPIDNDQLKGEKKIEQTELIQNKMFSEKR